MKRNIKLYSLAIPTLVTVFFAMSGFLYMPNIQEEDTSEENKSIIQIAQPTQTESLITESSSYENLGEFKLTAYCPCEKCCGHWANTRPVDENGNKIILTASGKEAKENYTVAADTNVLPFGTKIYINDKEYEVMDRGGLIKNKRIDVYFATHEEACNFGLQYADVFIKQTL